MSARVAAGEVDRLDAISRQRALDDRESRQLQNMLSVQARYRSMQAANARAREPHA